MSARKEKYVVDSKGKPVSVIVGVREYRQMLRDLEERESIKAYDRAKASGGETVPFDQAFEEIERSRQ